MADPFSLMPFDQAGMGLFGPAAFGGDNEERRRRIAALAASGGNLPQSNRPQSEIDAGMRMLMSDVSGRRPDIGDPPYGGGDFGPRTKGVFTPGPPINPYGEQPTPFLATTPSGQGGGSGVYNPSLADGGLRIPPFGLQGSPFAGLAPQQAGPPAMPSPPQPGPWTSGDLPGGVFGGLTVPLEDVMDRRRWGDERANPFIGPIPPASSQFVGPPNMPGSAGSGRGPGPLSFSGLGASQVTGADAEPKTAPMADFPQLPANVAPPSEARGTFDSMDRYTPSPLEQRIANVTGVAYGQMPYHFDPKFRQQQASQLDAMNLATQDNAAKERLLSLELAARERMGAAENKSQIERERLRQQPSMPAMRSDMYAKILERQLAVDPDGFSMRRFNDEFAEQWPRMAQMFGEQGGQAPTGPMPLGVERPAFGAPPLPGLVGSPAFPPGTAVGDEKDAARKVMEQIRTITSLNEQTDKGNLTNVNRALGSDGVIRAAQIYNQANLTPGMKAEFLRQFELGRRGGLGDQNAFREVVAKEAAKLYLQTRNFGLDFYDPNKGFARSVDVPNPNDPSQSLMTLGSPPQGFGSVFPDGWESLMTRPLSLIDYDEPGALPWKSLTVPGRGIVDFDRSGVTPTFNRAAASERAKRDAETLLRFYADIASRRMGPTPQAPR